MPSIEVLYRLRMERPDVFQKVEGERSLMHSVGSVDIGVVQCTSKEERGGAQVGADHRKSLP